MDILKRMEKDHRTALDLIHKLEGRIEKDDATTTGLVTKLCDEIKVHSKSEEKALYTQCEKKNIPLRDIAVEGKLEHHLIEETLDTLAKTKPADDGKFKAALSVVRELLEHHALEEEEKTMFPKIKKAFTDEERLEMGANMEIYKEKLSHK